MYNNPEVFFFADCEYVFIKTLLRQFKKLKNPCTLCGMPGHVSTYCWYQGAMSHAKAVKNDVAYTLAEHNCWFGENTAKRGRIKTVRDNHYAQKQTHSA